MFEIDVDVSRIRPVMNDGSEAMHLGKRWAGDW